jgi:hypothetical protein
LTRLTGLRLQKHDHPEAEIIVDASYPGEQGGRDNRCNSMIWKPDDPLVHSKTTSSISIKLGVGIHSSRGGSERRELDTTIIRGNENQNNRTDNSINRQRCSTETLSIHNSSTENTTHRQSVSLYTGPSWEGIFDCEENSGRNESSRFIDEIDFSALFEGADEGNRGIGMDWSTINLNL